MTESNKLLEKNHFFKTNTSDVVYNCLKNNGIMDLETLFYYDDNKMIDYGKEKRNAVEIKCVVKLLRYIYLNEPLNMEPILNKKLNSTDLQFDVLIRSLGFNKNETRTLTNNKHIVLKNINDSTTVLDLLRGNYEHFSNNTNSKAPNLLNKLNIIINPVEKIIKEDSQLDKLKQLRQEIKNLKESRFLNEEQKSK